MKATEDLIWKQPLTKVDKDKCGPWAVVTDASSGVGREFARRFAANGLHPYKFWMQTDFNSES